MASKEYFVKDLLLEHKEAHRRSKAADRFILDGPGRLGGGLCSQSDVFAKQLFQGQ